MGDIYKSSYTTALPEGASVKGQSVTWTDKRGKKRIGKLSSQNRVLIETDKYMARWNDEAGKEHKEPTGCTSKEAALHFLRNKELEVERIRAGITTRQEANLTIQKTTPINDHLDAFDTHRTARGITKRQISDVRKNLMRYFFSLKSKRLPI